MADVDALGGQYGALYIIPEVTPNVTPDAADWPQRVFPLKDFRPNFNRNDQPITSGGSKRLIGHSQGAAWDIGFNILTEAMGDSWLNWLAYMFGSSGGTGDPKLDGDRLPLFSMLADINRDQGGSSPYHVGYLYNGCKLTSATIAVTMGPDPISITLAGRSQYAQENADIVSNLPRFIGFQGTGGDPLTINSLPSPPAVDLEPVKYFHFQPRIKYAGESYVDIARVGSFEFGMTQAVVALPDRVVGADGLVYPVWAGFAEDAMELLVRFRATPSTLQYYHDVVYDTKRIDELELIYTAPPGYSTGSKTIRFHNGRWETGDYSITEILTMTQELPAKFESVEIV